VFCMHPGAHRLPAGYLPAALDWAELQ